MLATVVTAMIVILVFVVVVCMPAEHFPKDVVPVLLREEKPAARRIPVTLRVSVTLVERLSDQSLDR
jgi:hypothetical protein